MQTQGGKKHKILQKFLVFSHRFFVKKSTFRSKIAILVNLALFKNIENFKNAKKVENTFLTFLTFLIVLH